MYDKYINMLTFSVNSNLLLWTGADHFRDWQGEPCHENTAPPIAERLPMQAS